jgi:hypothetical protein
MFHKILLFLCLSCFLFADEVDEWTKSYNALLKTHVQAGEAEGIKTTLVNYPALRSDSTFKKLFKDLANLPPLDPLNPSKQLAMWINAYNFFILKIVVDHPEVKSINDLNTLFSTIWKKKVGFVGKKKYSVDDIEHSIIRKKFQEPRVHFALSTASLSSPDLAMDAYQGEHLDTQLDQRMKVFLGDSTKGLRIHNEQITLSPILKWHSSDFKPNPQTWLQEHKILSSTQAHYPIFYFDYNWSLNAQASKN